MAKFEDNEDNLEKDVIFKDEIMTESPKVYKLLQWALRQTSKGSIFLEGYLENTDLLWRSSCIKFRLSARQLCTHSGSVYELVGSIDAKESLEHGVSCDLVDAFWNGFPEDWEDLLNCDIFENKPDDTNMGELQTTRFDTSSFNRTRSGRIVVPRLASWRGERIIWQKDGDFHISTGFLEKCSTEYSEESINKIKNRLRKSNHKRNAIVESPPKAQKKSKRRPINRRSLQQYSTRSKVIVQKENYAPKINTLVNAPKKRSSNITPRVCLRKLSCSETEVRTISPDANVLKMCGKPLENLMTSRSMSKELVSRKVTRQQSQPDKNVNISLNNKIAVERKPLSEFKEAHEKKLTRKSTRLEKSAIAHINLSLPDNCEHHKLSSKLNSVPVKCSKRKNVHDDPLPKRNKRNNQNEKPILEIAKTRNQVQNKAGFTQETNRGQDGERKMKSSVLLPTLLPKLKKEKNTRQVELISKGPDLQRKTAVPEPIQENAPYKQMNIQEKVINQDKITKKKPTSHKPSHQQKKSSAVPDTDQSMEDSCLTLTPCARIAKGSIKKSAFPAIKKKLARPGTLRYEEDIRRFIREHNEDEDDDDFLSTTPFRASVPTLHMNNSFLKKVATDNDDEDIANINTPKSVGGLPSPFTPKKTPDISGGVIGQLIQPLNMKHVDHLVYRINKRRKRKPHSIPQTMQNNVMNNAATPVLPKLTADLEDYVIEAISDHESENDEDKDYYFSDEESP